MKIQASVRLYEITFKLLLCIWALNCAGSPVCGSPSLKTITSPTTHSIALYIAKDRRSTGIEQIDAESRKLQAVQSFFKRRVSMLIRLCARLYLRCVYEVMNS
jgi:hypothetical protein